MNSKTFKVFLLILFISPFINIVFGAQSDDTVSDRELLLLTAVSYSNKQEMGSEVQFTDELKDRYRLPHDMVSQDEVKGWTVLGFDINDGSSKDGFSIYVFKKGNNIVISARGTDGGVFAENWRYLMSSEHPQAKYMEYYVRQLVPIFAKDESLKVYFCGHSLGGYLSLYGTGIFMQYPEMRKHFVRTVTFNGLGLGRGTNMSVLNELYKLKKEQIVNYRIDGDVISCIGDHITLCVSLDLAKSPFTDNAHWWEKIPAATAHALVQFFFQAPFLPKPQSDDAPSNGADSKSKTEIQNENKNDSLKGESAGDVSVLESQKVSVAS